MRRTPATTARRSLLTTSRKLLVALAITASVGGAVASSPAQAEPQRPKVKDVVTIEDVRETLMPLNPRPAPEQ